MWASFLIFGALVRFSWQDQYVLGYLTGSQRKPGDVVYPRPGVSISGAISYAVEEVNRDSAAKGLSRRISFVVAETFGEEDVSIEQTAKLWKNNVSGYIGPQETCIHEGRMAASFNLPMISYFCIDQETSDKRYFRTFARTRPPDTQISKSLASLLLSFDWRKVIFLFPDSKDDVLRKVASTIVKSLETAEITILQTKSWHVFYQFHPLSANPFHRLVQETCQEGRIYVILGSHDEHLGLLVAMEERRLLSGGEYFVVGVELEQYDERDPEKYLRGVLTSSPDPVILRALTGYLRVAPSPSANMKNFSVNVNEYMKKPPFNFPGSTMKKVIPAEAAYLYDAVHLYAKALNRVLQNNGNPLNGTAMIEAIKGTHYKSAMGYMVYMDDNGDAEGNYTLLARKRRGNISENFGLYPVGLFIRHDNSSWLPTLVLSDKIEWVRDSPPVSEPTCGFRGEKCITHTSQIAGTIAGTILLICLVASLVFYRNWKYEQELDSLLWKIDFKDIETNENDMANSLGTKITRATHPLIRTSQVSLSSNPDADFRYSAIYTSICIYKGRVFAMQKVKKKSIDMTREMKKELKIMRDLRHENLNPFIGACTEAPNICIISEYCTRGSLRDILENEDVKLDNMFVASLVGDIVRGMIYLHDSPIKYHGKLKTSNCLVDSRWVLKLTDFGLREFKKGAESALDEASNKTPKLEGLLYKSPELLRLERNISDENGVEEEFGTQKGDVYSFAIILHELHSRRGPFGDSGLSHSIILDKVINYDPLKPPFRPHLDALENNFDFVRECLKECWAENPEERPDFKSVRTKLRPMRKGMKPNIFDNMMAMMEKYANNLEALVDDRTDQLVEEKKKTEALLYEMLPRYVAEQLKRGNKVEAENFDCVTIYFSDIVGFTAMSAESTPLQVVDFLNDLYTCFDSTIENYDVYKVETIGDAYMVVSGLPIRNGDQHAGEIATMSLHLLEAVKKFRIKHRPGEIVKLRIGIHSGPVCAGVVGLKMPRYCLFGDTVNTASRMESTGNPGHIHCSSETKILLERLGGYHLAKRGVVLMKGKGDQLTYWLKGENEEDRVKRSKEREERRALTGGNKSKHKHSQAHTRQNQQPRSSLKSKHHAGCSARRNPLSRCSSLESPKKLRFASIDHRISKDPLLEVISDSSPKKSSHLDVGSTDHVRRTSSSCPCIEKFETNTSTNLGVLQFLNSNYYNNNNYTCSSVPLLNADVSVKTSVTAPSSPGGFDCANNINIYLDPDEVSISAPLLDKQLFND